ncbi:MAG: hypothetical protein PHU51_01210 [Candidatus Nanoarchaeia archaeon]|nr:hypothetical protein [Candidatus Nanoarchaeia archaeon]
MSKEKQIELLEYTYLQEFYHFLKFVERRMLIGFETKEAIKEDWISKWDPADEGKGISSFAVGAERIIYALFNAQGFGQPNSAPVGSDLFFETNDAFIHIDLKTVQTRNIGDYSTDIFVGDNQNSYIENIVLKDGTERPYTNAALPFEYKNKGNPKPCLSFFITILYDESNLEILNINILSMPNGILAKTYGSDVLKAGKNPGKIRFNFSKTDSFKLIEGNPKRIKVVYFNSKMNKRYADKLKFIKSIYNLQSN